MMLEVILCQKMYHTASGRPLVTVAGNTTKKKVPIKYH